MLRLVECFSNQLMSLKRSTNLRWGWRVRNLKPGSSIASSSVSELWSLTSCKAKVLVMCDVRALTVRTLGKRNLLDACPVSTGKHLHLTLVLVELAVWPTNWLPVITAVPVASAALKLLLLQTAKHIVALVRLHKTCRGNICVFKKLMAVWCLWIIKERTMSLTYPLIGWTFHLIASGPITQLPC